MDSLKIRFLVLSCLFLGGCVHIHEGMPIDYVDSPEEECRRIAKIWRDAGFSSQCFEVKSYRGRVWAVYSSVINVSPQTGVLRAVYGATDNR